MSGRNGNHDLCFRFSNIYTVDGVNLSFKLKHFLACLCCLFVFPPSSSLMTSLSFPQLAFFSWEQAFYDEVAWMNILEGILGDRLLIDLAAEPLRPLVSFPSTLISSNPAKVMLWRSYNYPVGHQTSRFAVLLGMMLGLLRGTPLLTRVDQVRVISEQCTSDATFRNNL